MSERRSPEATQPGDKCGKDGVRRPQNRKERGMQSYSNVTQDYSADNEFDYGRRAPGRTPQRTRRSATKRGVVKTSVFNGMHRRRNKHWNW